MSGKRVLGFLIARPLIALAIAALVVGGILVFHTHEQPTPVIHRRGRRRPRQADVRLEGDAAS